VSCTYIDQRVLSDCFSVKCVVLKQRPFKCTHPGCDWAFGEKSNLKYVQDRILETIESDSN
jgi:hypothetical protein